MRARGGPGPLLALVALVPLAAGANVNGNVDIQSQSVQTSGEARTGGFQGTTATLLQETISLHYAGLPFGSTVALVTLGGGFTNIDGALGNGSSLHGRATSFDLSAALLPRRSYPLRIFTRGSVVDGSPGVVASTGGAATLAYGASLNLEPGTLLPGLRLEAEEGRSSHLRDRPLSDIRRMINASAFKDVGDERLNLTLRLDSERRQEAGEFATRTANFSWISPRHQTLLLASEVQHSGLADVAGLTSERQVSASHLQRWSQRLSSDVALQLSEASATDGKGMRENAQASLTLLPFLDRQLTISGTANAGAARTTSTAAQARGTNYGGGGRVGYAQPLSGWQAGISAGAAANACNCEFGNSGTQTTVVGGVSMAKVTEQRVSLQIDYNIARVFAPATRGGRRLEQHARASARLPVTESADTNFALGYDDGYRELIDLHAGTAYTLREVAGTGAAGLTFRLGRGSLNTELRHSRGAVIVPPARFVSGTPATARALTSGTLAASYSALERLSLQAQLAGSWTELKGSPPMTSAIATLGATYRFGRMTFTAQYQYTRTDVSSLAGTQQTIRASFSRPFEL